MFKIQHSKNSNPVIVHGDNLKPYFGQKQFTWFNSSSESRSTLRNSRENNEDGLPSLEEFVGNSVNYEDQSNAEHVQIIEDND